MKSTSRFQQIQSEPKKPAPQFAAAPPPPEWDFDQAVMGAARAGLAGMAVSLTFLAMAFLAAGRDGWTALKIASFPLLGERALAPGFDPAALTAGALTAAAAAALEGAAFAFLFFGQRRSRTPAVGVLYGLALWAVGYYALLPLIGAAQIPATIPPVVAAPKYALFGWTVGMLFRRYQPGPE